MFVLANPFAILFWGFVGLILFLSWKGYFKKERFWYFGPFSTLVYSFICLYGFLIALTYFAKSAQHDTLIERLELAEASQDVAGEIDIYEEELSEHPNNLDHTLGLVEALNKIPEGPEYERLRTKRDFYREVFIKKTVLGDDCEKSLSAHALMHWFVLKREFLKARPFADVESSCHSARFYMKKARLMITLKDTTSFNESVAMVLNMAEDPSEGFYFARKMNENNPDYIQALVQHPRANRYIDFNTLRKYHLRQGNWGNYLYALYTGILLRYHPFYVLVALGIVLVIGYYLYSIDVYDRDSLWRLLTMFLLACAIVPLSLLIYDLYENGWDWYSGFANKGSWLWWVLNVALTEETIKIVVMLVAVYLLRWANEPLDYIIYASMGALAFAFLENTMYFDRTEGEVVFARTIFSTIGHVFDSSLIGYGLAVNRFRFRKKLPVVLLLPVLLIFSSLWHGTFNAILSLNIGMVGYYIFVPYAILITGFLGGMINNSINNSPNFRKEIVASNDKGINLIATAFIWLYIIQQCIEIYIHGDFDSTLWKVLNTLVLVAILVMLFGYFLATFDIVKGQWRSPWQMIFRRRRDFNTAIGLNCELYTSRIDEVQHVSDYLFGNITDRVVIGREDTFFLVRLKTPYTYQGKEYKSVVVSSPRERNRIMLETEMFVHFLVPIGKRVKFSEVNDKSMFQDVGWGYLSCPKALQTIPAEFSLT